MTRTFTLASPDLTARISTRGARLEALHLRDGPSLVLHSDDPIWRDSYGGTIVGPVANRVSGGRMQIDGKTHQMPCNENGVTALHSGPDGLDRHNWQVIDHSGHKLHLRCRLADGAGGLPGNRCVEVTYALEGPCLALDITATTDATTAFSIAHHPYWRLGDARDHRLQVMADSYLPLNDQNLPTGDVRPVAGTVLDHRSARPVDLHTDHNFCISDHRHGTARLVATLHGTGGLTLTIHSTEPGLQVYAGAFLPDLPDDGIGPGVGLALEPQGWPDSVNQPGFPSIIASSHMKYHQKTRYVITA